MYLFDLQQKFEIEPGESIRISTGIRCHVLENCIFNLSVWYFKGSDETHINKIGELTIDQGFNSNSDGHIELVLRNFQDYSISCNEIVVQGYFVQCSLIF